MIAALHELAQYPQWVCRDQAKAPINPHTGGNAKSNNPATWAPYAEAVAAARALGLPGVGFVPTRHDPFVAGDIDHCIAEDGTIHLIAQAIIDQVGTYCEVSPSGTGVRFIARGTLPAALRRAPLGEGMQLELFPFGQYVTITGRHISGTPETINDAQIALDGLYARYASAPPAPSVRRPAFSPLPADERYPLAWVQAVIRNKQDAAARMVINAADGQRHSARLAAGNLLGGLLGWLSSIGHGHLLTAEAAEDVIYDARPPATHQASERRTIAAAIDYGQQSPLDIPPPETKAAPAPAPAWAPPSDGQVITVDQRYLEIPSLRTKVLMVKSAMGTGKTEAMTRLIPADARLLVITHRVALGAATADRLATDFYQDHTHNLDACRRLTITLDSLDKLTTDPANAFDYVLIDESEQVLQHLAGGTIEAARRPYVVSCLAFWLAQAEHVIYADANLDQITHNFARRQHGAAEITYLVNTYAPGGRQFVAMPQKADVLAMLERNLAAGQTAYVTINSIDQVKDLALSIQASRPALRVMAIHSENSNTPEIQAFIKAINTDGDNTIHDYDVVIASPSLGTGVSIRPATPWADAVYIIGETKVNQHQDLMQMAGRVREIKSGLVYSWIAPQVGAEITDPATLRAQVLQNNKDTAMFLRAGGAVKKDKATGYTTAQDEDYLALWCDIRSARNRSINTLAANFYAAAERDGHTVVGGQPASDADRASARAASAEARAQREADEYQALVTAPALTPAQYDKLKAQRSQTADELAAMKQYEITHFYEETVLTITPELVKAHDKGLAGRVIRLAQLLTPDLALATDQDTTDHYTADKKHASAAAGLRGELLELLITFDGLTSLKEKDFSNVITLTDDEAAVAGWLAVNAPTVKRLLGLSADLADPRSLQKFITDALAQLGLKRVQVRQDAATRRRIYALDQATLAMMLTYAERYTARKLAEQNAEADLDAAAGTAAIEALTGDKAPQNAPECDASRPFTITPEWQPWPRGVALEGADYEADPTFTYVRLRPAPGRPMGAANA